MADTLLEVSNLKKYFKTSRGMLHAVDDISFTIERGKTLPEGKEKAKLLLDIAEVYEQVAQKPFTAIEREYHLFS